MIPRAGNPNLPAYQIEPLEGTVTVRKLRPIKSKDGVKKALFEEVQVEENAGFMVHTRRGDSFRVKDEAGLKALGLSMQAPVVDDDGNVVGDVPSLIQRARARQTLKEVS